MICKDKACYRVAKTQRMPYLCRSFPAKEPTVKFVALLRKMTCKDKTSYDSVPPCSELTFENFISNELSEDHIEFLTNHFTDYFIERLHNICIRVLFF